MRPRRRGLTLVEVLIAIVLLGIVGAGITRLLSSQMRFFSRTSNQREARAVSRNALNLVRQELRMVEPRGIVAASADSVRVRLPYAMGIYCGANTVTFAPVDSVILSLATYGGYAYRDTTSGAVTTYVAAGTGTLSNGNAATCTGNGITPVPGGTLRIVQPNMPITTLGVPVFLFHDVTFRFANSTLVPGRTALWRQRAGGTAEEVAVPFDATSRFRFYVNGAATAQDAVPGTLNTMTGLELVLRGESERTLAGSNAPVEALTRVPIFFRNAVQ